MVDAAANASARVSAAQALLDRGWGKSEANVTINHKRDEKDWTSAELDALLADAIARNGIEGQDQAESGSQQPDSVH